MGKLESFVAGQAPAPRKRRPSPFTQSDVTRAIKAAKAAGMTVTRCEISADGSIVLTDAPIAPPAQDAFATWKAKRESRADGHS